jgi:hypothetical protein
MVGVGAFRLGQKYFDQWLKPPVEPNGGFSRCSESFGDRLKPPVESNGGFSRCSEPFGDRLKPPVEPNGGFSRCSESFWEQPLFGILLGTAAVRNPFDVSSYKKVIYLYTANIYVLSFHLCEASFF